MPPQVKAKPQRMCVNCRKRFDQDVLTRLTLTDGRFTLWKKGAKGRSIYICSNECFQQAKKRRFFERNKAAVSTEVEKGFEEAA
jgi:predicted RNA-binding protein YlxR (DUF448 family)